MTDPMTQLKNRLKGQGLSLTFSRKLIFSALLDRETQTINELIKTCLGEVDRVTVYRNVALFERLGIVQRRPIGWKYRLELSDAFHRHHHHLTCLNCGRIIPLPEDPTLESRLKHLARNNDFLIQDHELEIQGLCQDCSPKT
jgi:Fur family transcriptional regulator, ferric uptake regulator